MARKIVFFADAGLVGTDAVEGFIYPDTVTNEILDGDAWEFAVNNAEMYGVYPYLGDLDEDEDIEEYSDNIEGYWEDYDPEEHDSKLTYCDEIHWCDCT